MTRVIVVGFAAFGVAVATPAAAQSVAVASTPSSPAPFSLTTGVDYSSGDYGTGVDTNILVVPIMARVTSGNFRASATLPWIRINGANIIAAGDGGPIVIDPNAPRTIRKGIGDLSLSATYAVPEESFGVGVEFTGRVKLPTGSTTKGLSTGKADFSGSVELSKTFGGVTPFVEAGYTVRGDPSYIDLKNTWFGSAGASLTLGKSVLLVSYDYQEAASPLSKSSQDIFGAVSTPFSKRLNLTLYGSAGLSDGAPDYGLGAMITIKPF